MELEVGMYIRTKDGKIAKFIKYDEEDKEELVTDYYEYSTIWIKDVIEASHNIIDLIEVGDYANGCKVIKNTLKDGGNIVIVQGGNCFTNDDIKTVVTKEQFSSMEYRLGDK